ncbi:MAG: nucleotidyl transferase AbiEii/AbiGii toxin family protein [Dehalococcoidia bacterium]|nr:nucleotidyl transferase AbiEii/AbiGii toxin family protein [Dehalococcoidia bacterium]
MSKAQPTNVAASVRQRLLNLSRDKGEDFNFVLTQYALERFLYRLASSEYADRFVLKGAMLFAAWSDRSHRPTRDLDLLGYGDASEQQLITTFQQICQAEVEPDGLEFDAKSIRVTEIREDQDYDSRRMQLVAKLEKAQIHLQIDIGFGDAVTPEAEEIDYPTLLDFPAPRIWAYPRETVVAEKLQAMIALGMPNTRMKDFYDVWMIARHFSFDGTTLVRAITATFDRRKTKIPNEVPTALGDEFATDRDKVTQWKAFLQRSRLEGAAVDLSQVVDELRAFLIPPLFTAANSETFNQSWTDGGPWL